jgi:outer membrane cobalamin receptor
MLNTLLILTKRCCFDQVSAVHRLIQEKKCVFFIILFISISPSLLFSQEIKEFEEVDVLGKYRKLLPKVTIDKNEIEELAPHDLGHLLQRVSGVSIRSYGGLGGMKTISLRGLGGEHTKLLVNGLPNSNVQNGQTDFGLIQLDNIEKVSVNIGESENMTPVSTQVYGSVVSIQTFENTFSDKKIRAISSATIGSFGQKEGFIALKKGGETNFVSVSGKYRQVEGNYPYRIQMGSNEIQETRRNNSFEEYFINIGTGFKWRRDSINGGQNILKINANTNASNKQLPGAVIIYNDYADESLETENYTIGGNYSFYQKQFKLKVFGVYQNKFLKYYDPSYFNLDGFIENQYNTSITNGGVNAFYKYNSFSFTLGTDVENSRLKNNRDNLGLPERFSSTSMLKVNYTRPIIELYAAAFNQYYVDKNQDNAHRNEFNRINTQFGISSGEKISKAFDFYAWLKQSMRPPSFNELYYTQIGNTSLQPEDALQLNVGATFNKAIRKTSIGIRSNIYNNYIDNKILALPTKNLFVWSISNVGKVYVLGGDFEFNLIHKINKKLSVEANGSLTYQEVKDRTEENSPTYGHQLAYTPKITSNGRLSINYKDLSIYSSLFYVGERFSLNQNTNSNLVEDFTLIDCSVGYQFKLSGTHLLKAQFGVKNIFDTSYSYIRYFVMPGRNYFLKIAYEFN